MHRGSDDNILVHILQNLKRLHYTDSLVSLISIANQINVVLGKCQEINESSPFNQKQTFRIWQVLCYILNKNVALEKVGWIKKHSPTVIWISRVGMSVQKFSMNVPFGDRNNYFMFAAHCKYFHWQLYKVSLCHFFVWRLFSPVLMQI